MSSQIPQYREVVRSLGECSEETRQAVLGSWGGDRERWGARDRELMARALTRREDTLEFLRGSSRAEERTQLRAVRRRLELTLE
jgi:hypothetical protein